MKIPFVGGSYQMQSRSWAVQRSINLMPIVSEVQGTKSVSALRCTAGLSLYATAGSGGIRGNISSTSGRAFVVSANEFYEINTDGTSTLRGTLNTQTNRVMIAESKPEILIVDGADGWIFTKATNTFTQITDPDFPATSYCTYQDGYFIVTKDNSQDAYISGINDGLSWGTLDFTAVESSPDDLVACISDSSNLWFFGNRSVEAYQNTGNASFPFERIAGAVIPTGCAGRFTAARFDNSIAWLGIDDNGDGVVWRAEGYQAKRISTQAIERRISEADDFTESYAWVYHQEGHIFYCLQIKGLDTTLVYDGSTGMWHERSYKNPVTNAMELHRGSCHMFFDQKNLVGDRENGNIYELRLDVYDDNGDEMIKTRISPHLQAEKKLLSFASFELDMETGVGLTTGQGSDPQVMMRYSNDGGNTWSAELWRDIGKIGEYNKRVIWRKLGTARDRVWEVSVSDPVFVQFNEAYINAN